MAETADDFRILLGATIDTDDIRKKLNGIKDLSVNVSHVTFAGSAIDDIKKQLKKNNITLNVDLGNTNALNRQTQNLGQNIGSVISKATQSTFEGVMSDSIGRYFRIDETDSKAFEKEANRLVAAWTQNKGKVNSVQLTTKTVYDKEAEADITALKQAVISYQNEVGEAIQKTVAWRQIGNSIDNKGQERAIMGFAEVASKYSKTLDEASSLADNFSNKVKETAAKASRDISKIWSDATTSVKPIQQGDSLDRFCEQAARAEAAVEELKQADSSTFTDAKIKVEDEVSALRILVKELQNAEYVATSLRTKDIDTIKQEELSKIDAFIAKMEQSGHATNELRGEALALKSILGGIADRQDLVVYLDLLGNLEAEFSKIEAEAKATEKALNIKAKIDLEHKNLSALEPVKKELQESGRWTEDLEKKWNNLSSSLGQVKSATGLSTWKTELTAFKNEMSSAVQQVEAWAESSKLLADGKRLIDNKSYDVQFAQLEAGFKKTGDSAEDAKGKLENARRIYQAFNDAINNKNSVEASRQWNLLDEELVKLQNNLKIAKIEAQDLLRPLEGASKIRLENKITKWLQQNTAATAEAKEAMAGYLREVQNGVSVQRGSEIGAEIDQWTNKMRAMGKLGASTFGTLRKDMGKFAQWIGASRIVMKIFQEFKEGIQLVKDLDAALTNINYTMNVSSSQLSKIGQESVNIAKELKTATSDVLGAVTLYANANETTNTILEKTRTAVMLSNVFGGTPAQAADMLQGVSNQFDIEQTEEGLRHISDVIQNVSQNLAYDFSKGIGAINEAVETAGATANAAGVSFESFAAMVGKTIEVTRQSGSTVGNAYKTIFSRITKASKTEATPEEDVSKAEASLRKVGVRVRQDNDPNNFREMDEILSDLGKVWDTLDSVTQSEISYNIAGVRQTNILKSLLANWSEYEELVEKTGDAEGTTLENQEKYAKSIKGRLTELQAVGESFWTHFLDSDTLKFGISSLTTMLKLLEGMSNILNFGGWNSFGTFATGLGAYFGIRNNGLFRLQPSFNDENKQTIAFRGKELGQIAEDWRAAKGKGFKARVGSIFSSSPENVVLSDDQKQMVRTWNNALAKQCTSQETFNRIIADADNKTKSYFKGLNGGKASIDGLQAAQEGAKQSTIGLTLASTALNMAITMGLSIGIQLLVGLFDELVHAAERTEERANGMTESLKNFQKEAADGNKNIKELANRYKELDKAMNGSIDATKMTTAQRDEYHSICNQIGEIMPELVKAYDSEGNAILTVKGNLEELTEAYKKNRMAAARDFLLNGNENGNSVGDILKGYKNSKKGTALTNPFDHSSDTNKRAVGTDKLSKYLKLALELNNEELDRELSFAGSKIDLRKNGINSDAFLGEYTFSLLGEHGVYTLESHTDEQIDNIRNILQADLDSMETETEQYADGIQYILSALLFQTDSYWKDFDAETRDQMLEFEGNFTSDFIDKNSLNTEDALYAFNRKIIKAFQDDDTKDIISNLLSPDDIDLSMAGKYIEKVEQALDVESLADSMDLSGVIANYNNALDTTSASLDVDRKELEQFFKDNSINTQEEIDRWIEVAKSAKTADEAKKAYLSSGVMLSEDLKAVYDYNKTLQENKKILEGFKNGDYQRVDGNIDHFNRRAIDWTDEKIENQRDALESWNEISGVSSAEDFAKGHFDLGLSAIRRKSNITYTFTPVFDDGSGSPQVLDRTTFNAYLDDILKEATDGDGKIDFDKVLELDAQGRKVAGFNGILKNMIGFIGELDKKTVRHSVELAESWRETGSAITEVQEAQDKLAASAEAAGISLSMYINKINRENFNDFFNLGDSNTPTVLGNISAELDNIQNAYKTLQSAVQEYNKEGYISVDTYQSILGLGSQYLQYLFDENGNLNMNAEALQKVALAHVEEIRLKAIDGAISNVEKINSETMADTYLAAQNYQLAESYEVLAESRLKAWAAAAPAQGISDAQITQILDVVRSQIKNIDSLSEKTGKGIKKGYGLTGESAKDAADKIDDIKDKIKDTEEKLADLDKQEHLANLKYSIDTVNHALEQTAKILERIDTLTNLTFESDFTAKLQNAGQQFLTASRYGGEMRTEMERLLAIEPRTADEAEELASSLESLSDKFFENEQKILEYRNAMYDTVIEFQSAYIEHINERNDAVKGIVDDTINIMERGSLTGGFWSRSLLPSVSKDKVKKQRQENNKLVAEEERYQQAIAQVRKKAIDMAKAEEDEEREKQRAEYKKQLEDYKKELAEASSNFTSAVGGMKSAALDASDEVTKGLNGVGNTIDGVTGKVRELKDNIDQLAQTGSWGLTRSTVVASNTDYSKNNQNSSKNTTQESQSTTKQQASTKTQSGQTTQQQSSNFPRELKAIRIHSNKKDSGSNLQVTGMYIRENSPSYGNQPVLYRYNPNSRKYDFFVQEKNTGEYRPLEARETVYDKSGKPLNDWPSYNATGGLTTGTTIVNDGTGKLAGREGYIGKDGKLHWFNDEKNIMFDTDEVVRVISAPDMQKILKYTGDKYFNTPIGDLNSVTAYAEGNTSVSFKSASSSAESTTAQAAAKQMLTETDAAFKNLKGKVSLNGLKDVFYSTIKDKKFSKEFSQQISSAIDSSDKDFEKSIKGLIIENAAWDDIPDELRNKLEDIGASSENWSEWIGNSDNALQAFNLMEGSGASSWDFLNETIITLLQDYGIDGKEAWDTFIAENPLQALQLLISSWSALEALIQQYINDCIDITTKGAEAIHAIKIQSPDISQESWDALQTLIANKIQEILNVINETFGENTIDLNFSIGTKLDGNALTNPQGTSSGNAVVNTARAGLGTRYVWGGTSSSGWDCSGFLINVMAQNGIAIPERTTQQQWASSRGQRILDKSQLQPGDAMYFANPGGNVHHVAIYAGNGQMIHAANERLGTISQDFSNSAYYQSQFVGAKRYYASGTTGAKEGMAILGDEGLQKGDTKNTYPELVFSKSTGKAFLAGLNGAEMVRLGAGDTVVPYSDTRKFLANGGFNAYAKGTKNTTPLFKANSNTDSEKSNNTRLSNNTVYQSFDLSGVHRGSTHTITPTDANKLTVGSANKYHWSEPIYSFLKRLNETGELKKDQYGVYTYKGAYLVAATSTFGKMGDVLRVTQEGGAPYYTIILDEQSQKAFVRGAFSDLNPADTYGHGDTIMEMEVDYDTWRALGSYGSVPNPSLKHNITKIENLGKLEGVDFSGISALSSVTDVYGEKLQQALQRIEKLMGTFKTSTHVSKSLVSAYKSLGDKRGKYDFETNFTAHANGTGDYHIVGENNKPEIMRNKRTGKMSVVDSPMLFDPNEYDVIGEDATARYLKSAKFYAKGTDDVKSEETDKKDTAEDKEKEAEKKRKEAEQKEKDQKLSGLIESINKYIEDDKKLTKDSNKFTVEELSLLERYLLQLKKNQVVSVEKLSDYLSKAKGEKADSEKAIETINEHLPKNHRLKYEDYSYTTDEYKALEKVVSTFDDDVEIDADKLGEYLDYGRSITDFEDWIENELDDLLNVYTTEYVDAYMAGQKEYHDWQNGFSKEFAEFAKNPTEGNYMERYSKLATEASDRILKTVEVQTKMEIDVLKDSTEQLKKQKEVAEKLYHDAPTPELQKKAIENLHAIDEALQDIDEKYADAVDRLGEQRLARYQNENLGYDSRTSFLERDISKLDRQIDKAADAAEKNSLLAEKRQKILSQSAIAEEKRRHAHQTVMDEVYNSQDEDIQKLLQLVKVDEAFDANGEFNNVHKNNIAMLNSSEELSALVPVYENMMNIIQEGKKTWVECTDAIDDYSDALDDIGLEEAQAKIEVYTENLERLNEIDEVRKGKQDAITSAMQQQHSLAQSLREEISNINAELDANKHTEQWLDEDTRKLIFNDEDYEAELKAINDIQAEANDAYLKYKSRIAELGETEWYKEQQITDEYNKRMDVLNEQLQVEKDKLAVKKNELEYNNALKERDTRIIIGGRSVQVANPDTMYNLAKERSQAQSDLNNTLLKNSETEQERQSDRISQSINQEIETRNKMVELIGKMSDAEQELFAATLPVIQELEVFKEALSPQNIPWLNSHSRDFRDDFVDMPELYKHGGYNQAHDYAGDYPVIEQLHKSGLIRDEVYEALTQQAENQHNWKRSTDVNTAQYPYTRNYGGINYGEEYYGINDEAKWSDNIAREQAREYQGLVSELNNGKGTQETINRLKELNEANAADNKYIANVLDATQYTVGEDGVAIRKEELETMGEIARGAFLGALKDSPIASKNLSSDDTVAVHRASDKRKKNDEPIAYGNFNRYASGTKSAKAGLALTDEEGYELKLKQLGGKFRALDGGEMIFSTPQSSNLFEFSQNPPNYIQEQIAKMNGQMVSVVTNTDNRQSETHNHYDFGGVVVEHPVDADGLVNGLVQKASSRYDVTKNTRN